MPEEFEGTVEITISSSDEEVTITLDGGSANITAGGNDRAHQDGDLILKEHNDGTERDLPRCA